MKSNFKRVLCAVILLSLAVSFFGCKGEAKSITKEIYALDTIISITAFNADDEALNECESEIRRLEALLSATDENSDISKTNASPDEWVRVSDETYYLVALSKEISEATKGSFDISVHPAVKLWGFTDDNYNVPVESEILNISEFIDYTKIELDDINNAVKIPENHSLDLGAIAKGYIADKAAEVLAKEGISSAILNFGGNIKLIGSKPEGKLWNIGVKTPFEDGYFATLSLENSTASTAGGYERYFEEDGRIYHHIINPHTAAPSVSDILSATVVGEKGELCDALATSAFVLGTDEISGLSQKFPDYSFVIFTYYAIFVSEALEGSISLSEEYKNTEIIYF